MIAQATPVPAPVAIPAKQKGIRLSRRLDRIHASIDGAEPVPVRVVWARPVTAPGGELALLDDKKRCLAMLPGLNFLEVESRLLAAEELARRYCVARIERVLSTRVDFGNRYWEVETDRGRRSFLLREPSKNVQRVGERLVIRDSLGNRYEIASLAGLDAKSRIEADRAL
jgi:hypothetical protein